MKICETNALARWIQESGMTRAAFAARIGVVPAYVTMLCADEPNWPGRDVAARIREVTDGDVTADDFLPAKQSESAA